MIDDAIAAARESADGCAGSCFVPVVALFDAIDDCIAAKLARAVASRQAQQLFTLRIANADIALPVADVAADRAVMLTVAEIAIVAASVRAGARNSE